MIPCEPVEVENNKFYRSVKVYDFRTQSGSCVKTRQHVLRSSSSQTWQSVINTLIEIMISNVQCGKYKMIQTLLSQTPIKSC